MYRRHLVRDVRAGATGAEVVRVHALARIMLGATVRNIQCSWVKEGPKLAQMLLVSGANDLGGTLASEHCLAHPPRSWTTRCAIASRGAGSRPASGSRSSLQPTASASGRPPR